jgi:hypothetical protein
MGIGKARILKTTVLASIASPLAFVMVALVAAFAYEPAAIARGDHLASLGLRVGACSGCGMCGMSRAFSALAHGDLDKALSYNRAVIVVFPSFVVVALVCGVALVWLARRPLRV